MTSDSSVRTAASLAHRAATGAGWGLAATAAMTAVMAASMLSGVAPMPEPIPVALAARVLGQVPMPLLLGLGLLAHFAYGGAFGAILAAATRPGRVTVWLGLGLGAALWLVMNVAWFPYLGWGPFATGLAPAIAVATLVLHLVYGGALGATLDRRAAASSGQD